MLCSLLHYCRGEHGFEAFGAGRRNNKNLRKGVWEESKKLWKIGFPSILARVTTFGMFIVTQAFIGHIGQLELATYALIQVIVVRFSNVVLLGMSSATETLCGSLYPPSDALVRVFVVCYSSPVGEIGYLFTSEEEVANSVADLSVLLSFSVLLNIVQLILSGKTYLYKMKY
ncbi:hypothetical protein V6N13_088715 [Hibiscus sabdariffa]